MIQQFDEKLYNEYKRRAINKNLRFEITSNDFTQLINGKCYYCASPPRKYKKSTRNGIDRINNSLGYYRPNVVSCCVVCNMAKRIMSHDDFIAYCERVYLDNSRFKTLTINERIAFYIQTGLAPNPRFVHQYLELGLISEEDIHYDYISDIVNHPSEIRFLKDSLIRLIKLLKISVHDYESKINKLDNEKLIELYRDMLINRLVNARRLFKYIGHDCKNIPKDYKFEVRLPPPVMEANQDLYRG